MYIDWKTAKKLVLLAPLFLSISCATLQIPPPSESKQAILVLPVKVNDTAHLKGHSFYYNYEIENSDDSNIKHEAVFKLPIDGDMLIVDSLPPGNYRVTKFTFQPKGTGEHRYGNNVQARNDKFKLESGKITIFKKTLSVKRWNKIPGRGRTTHSSANMYPVLPDQNEKIFSTLKSLKNIDAWQIPDSKYSIDFSEYIGVKKEIVDKAQGRWEGHWSSLTQIGSDGDYCGEGNLVFNIKGSELKGKTTTPNGNSFDMTGVVNKNGAVNGKFSAGKKMIAKISGGYFDGGEYSGKFEGTSNCSGKWQAQKKY